MLENRLYQQYEPTRFETLPKKQQPRGCVKRRICFDPLFRCVRKSFVWCMAKLYILAYNILESGKAKPVSYSERWKNNDMFTQH